MNAKIIGFVLVGICLVLSTLTGCGETDPDTVTTIDGRILIQDRTGKQWDITYAVNELQMSADQFNFGLGPDAILPILNPQFILPGDDDYPQINEIFSVLGVTVAGEHRAYRISHLSRHEVVDDVAGEVVFAATY